MKCNLCPRRCGVDRSEESGVCLSGDEMTVARAAPHYWEEPCISGKNGSGTVFFTGCSLHCVYCQNRTISGEQCGTPVTEERLLELFRELEEAGVHNVNLVTPDHFMHRIIPVLRTAKRDGFPLPFLMNCSGYETVEMIRALSGLIDVYMPDFKYASPLLAKKYSSAPDYPDVCRAAVAEMVRQQPRCVFSKQGLLQKGVLVRHLVLPGHTSDSKKILAELYADYGNSILYSIMSQFTPLGLEQFPEINRKVTPEEYEDVVDFAVKIGIKNAFVQEGDPADESFIPPFSV